MNPKRAVGMISILCITLGLLLASSPGDCRAARQDSESAWNLAVVLDPSALSGQDWLGFSRREALRETLRLTLPALPHRITVGLWAGGLAPMIAPRPARDIQAGHLDLPGKADADQGGSLASALAWLQAAGGGSVLLVAGPEFSSKISAVPENIFIQVLALDPGPVRAGLEELAAMGGGLYCQVDKPKNLTRLLRRALLCATSPSSLALLTHDPDNQPVKLRLSLQLSFEQWPPSPAYSGRPIQVPEGVWLLIWPKQSQVDAKELPERLEIGRKEKARLWIGGHGHLTIKGKNARGEPLDWRVRVARPRDGRLVRNYSNLPLELDLPGGVYLVNSLEPPHQWTVEVAVATRVEVTVGPPGHLLLEQPGPGGGLRLGYDIISSLSGRRVAGGYTGQPLRLLPGPYRLDIGPNASRQREVVLAPGKKLEVKLEPIALLRLEQGRSLGPVRYELRDNQDKIAAQGMGARRIPLLPGRYRLVYLPDGPEQELELHPGQLLRHKLP